MTIKQKLSYHLASLIKTALDSMYRMQHLIIFPQNNNNLFS